MKDPATRMMTLRQAALFSKERGSEESPSSPSMAQNPPMGSRRREYWVSPFLRESSSGPMPMENSFTFTPRSLAVKKWPNSWTAMSRPNIRIAIKIYSMGPPIK